MKAWKLLMLASDVVSALVEAGQNLGGLAHGGAINMPFIRNRGTA